MARIDEISAEVAGIWAQADTAGRGLHDYERKRLQSLLAQADGIRHTEQLRAMDSGGGYMHGGGDTTYGDSPGATFVKSAGYTRIKSAEGRAGSWTSGLVDAGYGYSTKGTLLEGSGSPGSGTGGGFLPTPQIAPGLVQKLFQPLMVENLLSSGVATGNQVRYAVEGTATSGAAGVAEGGNKPESTLAVSTLDEPIKKIATSVTISDELLEDATAVQSYINGRLTAFLNIETERQLCRGAAGGSEVQGLLVGRGVPVYSVATGGTAQLVAENLFRAMNGVRGSAFVEPQWIVMHPTDWQTLRLGKDSTQQYLGGGPFSTGAYGNGNTLQQSGQITGAVDTLWGKPVVVTTALGGAGTALIGTPEAAQVWSRGGPRVEATNSHQGNFLLDLTVLRAERRLGLTVYRPGAMVEVRL